MESLMVKIKPIPSIENIDTPIWRKKLLGENNWYF